MTKVWGLPAIVWVGLCLTVAVLYTFFWPQQKVTPDTGWLRYVIFRCCHALVWLLLALSFWLRGLDSGVLAANRVALAALFAYLLFMVTFLTS